jgi:hypothetical protein
MWVERQSDRRRRSVAVSIPLMLRYYTTPRTCHRFGEFNVDRPPAAPLLGFVPGDGSKLGQRVSLCGSWSWTQTRPQRLLADSTSPWSEATLPHERRRAVDSRSPSIAGLQQAQGKPSWPAKSRNSVHVFRDVFRRQVSYFRRRKVYRQTGRRCSSLEGPEQWFQGMDQSSRIPRIEISRVLIRAATATHTSSIALVLG